MRILSFCDGCHIRPILRHEKHRSFLFSRLDLLHRTDPGEAVRNGEELLAFRSMVLVCSDASALEKIFDREINVMWVKVEMLISILSKCFCCSNESNQKVIRDHRSKVEMHFHYFNLPAAISDCLLIGFIRATETLRQN